MKSAQETPTAKKATFRKTSKRILDLVEERKKNWDKFSNDEQKQKNYTLFVMITETMFQIYLKTLKLKTQQGI